MCSSDPQATDPMPDHSHAMRRHSLSMLVPCLVAACAMGPDYKRPPAALPEAWQSAPPAAGASGAAQPQPVPAPVEAPPPGKPELINTAWWSAFGDPQLDALILVALDENKDLRVAAYRIEQFDAHLQVNRSAGLPQVVAGGARTRDTLSENRQVPLAAGTPPVANAYEVSGTASWELDLWGRIRRSNEAALAELLATEESRRALVLSLVADVASSYVRLLNLDAELDILNRTVESRRETLSLLEAKLAGGGTSELPVIKARADLEETLADVPAKESEIAALEHALSALLGRNPGPIERGKPLAALSLPAIPGGLPADLLVQRPDVRKAEQDLVAANARIGVAKAQYLPSIALTSQSGFASAELNKLTMLTSNFGSFGASLLGPVFTSGRVSGQVREAEAVQRQMATTYLLAVQTALREVEDALVAHRKMHQRAASRSRQLDALREHRASALKRHEGGYTGYLEVLDAERSLYAGELQHSQTRRDQCMALIAVYKAMGGGWTVADHMAPSTSPRTTQ